MPFLEQPSASQLATLKQQQELLGRAGEDQRREAQRVLELVRSEKRSASLDAAWHADLASLSRDSELGGQRDQQHAKGEVMSSASRELSSPAPPLRSASKEHLTPRDQHIGDNARMLERETELLHQVARLTLTHYEEMQEAKERERELEMRVADLQKQEENRQQEQALELALQRKVVTSLHGQVDYVNKTCSKIADCEKAMDGCESKMVALVQMQEQIGGERMVQQRRREEKKQRAIRRIATLEIVTAFDAFILHCQASQEEKKLCRRVVDSVMLKNGKDLIRTEQALEECKAALAAAEFNLANAQRCAKDSEEELSIMKQRLMDEQKLAAHGSELQHTIDQLSEETTRLRQALEVVEQERDTLRLQFESFKAETSASLKVCKDQLEQREREVKVTKSELEESGSIIVDRLVITNELQKSNERLSAELKQVLHEKEEALSQLQSFRASEQEARQALVVLSTEKTTLEDSLREIQLGKKSALERCEELIRSSELQAEDLREASYQRRALESSKDDLQSRLDAALKELEITKVLARKDRESETVKLAEFEAMGKAVSEELARCEEEKARLEGACKALQQEVEAEREKMKRESSVWESEREAQRQVDKQRGYTEEKMLASERELQDEVKDLRDRWRRADEDKLELEKANQQNQFKIASLSSELSSARSQNFFFL